MTRLLAISHLLFIACLAAGWVLAEPQAATRCRHDSGIAVPSRDPVACSRTAVAVDRVMPAALAAVDADPRPVGVVRGKRLGGNDCAIEGDPSAAGHSVRRADALSIGSVPPSLVTQHVRLQV